MNLPDFRNHNGLNRLRELMRAPYIPDIKEKLIEGITITRSDEVRVDTDGTLLYKGQHVVRYIRDWIGEENWNKYHIVNCKWIQEMKRKGRYSRYVNAKPENGQFLVNRPNHIGSELLNLSICQRCLKKVELNEVYKPNEFPLSDWFDAIDDGYEPLPIDRIRSDGSYYIAAWRFLSWLCRKNAHWKCQGCGIELGHERSDRRFLHAHHTKGTRYNKLEDLIALCIHCHSKQEGVGHSQLTSSTDYQEFMKKYGDNIQARNQKNLQDQQSTAGQEYNTFAHVNS